MVLTPSDFNARFFLQDNNFAQNQKEVLMYDAKKMLCEAPLKQICIHWIDQEKKKSFKSCKNDLEKRQKAESLLSELEGGKIHHGRVDNYKRCQVPENMLIYLWLLRFMIYDERTLNNAVVFFSADTLPYVESDPRNIFHPSWIKYNILYPTMDVVQTLTNEASQTHKIFMAHYGYDRTELRKRFQESIAHCMAAEIIRTIIGHGFPAKFTPGMGNKQQEKNIADIKAKIAELNREHKYPDEQDVYTVFFQTIPFIIEKHIEQHYVQMLQHFYKSEQFVTVKSWPSKATDSQLTPTGGRKKAVNRSIDYDPAMRNFQILLPLKQEHDQIEVLSISEYFTAITHGNVPAKQLFIRPPPKEIGDRKRKLRDPTPVNYDEGTPETKRRAKKKTDQQAKLETDIEEFDTDLTAFFHDEYGYDGTGEPVADANDEQQIKKLVEKWKGIKDQLSGYKK